MRSQLDRLKMINPNASNATDTILKGFSIVFCFLVLFCCGFWFKNEL
jgi:hypothetical protein